MNMITAQELSVGDELSEGETPDCCDAPMDETTVEGHIQFKCGRCHSTVDVDDSYTVTNVRLA